MKTHISQKEIGQRVMKLRKAKGLSQVELAKIIKLSRSSLAQIELGNRTVDVLELHKLSMTLGFSMDHFLAREFEKEESLVEEPKASYGKTEERISIPTFNLKKFKNVLLYILEHCAGKPNVGETVLYKLLYFADFNYYEIYEEHLTGSKYRKLPYGPVPQKAEVVLQQMITAGQLKKIKTEYFNKTQTRYIPLMKANLMEMKASEKEVIDKVLEQMSDWNANKISEYSHDDLPWMATDDGDDIHYNLAFYRRPPYSVRVYEDDED